MDELTAAIIENERQQEEKWGALSADDWAQQLVVEMPDGRGGVTRIYADGSYATFSADH